MEEIGFPALRSHREQHARVLSALHHARPRVMEGDISVGRETLDLLPPWLVNHITTLDNALAIALQMKTSEATGHNLFNHEKMI
jgi:hemerythrin